MLFSRSTENYCVYMRMNDDNSNYRENQFSELFRTNNWDLIRLFEINAFWMIDLLLNFFLFHLFYLLCKKIMCIFDVLRLKAYEEIRWLIQFRGIVKFFQWIHLTFNGCHEINVSIWAREEKWVILNHMIHVLKWTFFISPLSMLMWQIV